MSCIFCKIAAKELEAEILYEDSEIMAIEDIHPQAPVHVLIIPKLHIPTINDTDSKDEQLLGRMVLIAKKLAQHKKIAEDGYRLVFNVNQLGGQEVHHIHLHFIGGRQMTWPPG